MDLEHKAIERLKYAAEISEQYYKKPLIVTYSGGKDSEVLLELAKRAGINFEAQHNHTTADAPETVRHVREVFRRLEVDGVPCKINYPPLSMWQLIPKNGVPPTKFMRYCCLALKEQGGKDRAIVTGVRWAESNNRKNNRGTLEAGRKHVYMDDNSETRREFESCQIKGTTTINPIVEWKDKDIWNFIRSEKLCMNPLYECGFDRVGCVGCPMAGNKRRFEFQMFPAYEKMYRIAFSRMLEVRRNKGKTTEWKTADDVFRWWMEDKNVDGQLKIDMDGDNK